MLGSKVGNYSIIEKLATGGMGEVYVARHDLMERDAVVKVLRPEMSVNTEMVQRFFNEARAAAAIQHPGIVDVYDMGYADDGRAFLVMEKLRGESLAERLSKTRVSTARAISYVRQLAGALGVAHERGIVHRDLKPDNLFVVPDPDVVGGERIKVLDFGIAKLAMEKGGSLVTSAGAVFGTPAYMAPEQCTSTATVDLRADLYAVGCIFYELLCGQPPFGLGGVELFAAHLRDEPAPPRSLDPSIPVELESIVLRLLAKNPEDRFQSCGQLLSALDACPSCGQLSAGPAGVAAQEGVAATMPNGTPSPLPTPSQLGSAATMPATDPRANPATSPHQKTADTRPLGQTADNGPYGSTPPQTVGSSGPAVVQPMTTQSASAGQTLSQPRGRRGGLWAAVALVVIAGVGSGVYALSRMGGGDGSSETDRQGEHRSGRRDRDGARTRESRVDRLLGEGVQALAREDWATAVGKATQVLSFEPENPAALDLQARAEGEIENRGTFRKLEDAAAAEQSEDVARLFGEIPEVSVYRDKARPLYSEARDKWFAPRLEQARALAKKHQCTKIAPLLEETVALFPDASPEIQEVADTCRPRSTARAAKPPSGGKPPKEPEPVKRTAEDMIAEARIAVTKGDSGAALRLCEDALAVKPGSKEAFRVCAVAACNLRENDKAAEYLKGLTDARQKRVVQQICRRAGVRLGGRADRVVPPRRVDQEPPPGAEGKAPEAVGPDDITLE